MSSLTSWADAGEGLLLDEKAASFFFALRLMILMACPREPRPQEDAVSLPAPCSQ